MNRKGHAPHTRPADENALRAAAEAKLAAAGAAPGDSADMDARRILHELQVHQTELEMQNEELTRTQAALGESRDKYVELYDFAPVGYCTLTRGGQVVEANLTAATMLGVPRESLLGRGLARFVAAEDLPSWDQHLASVLQSDRRQTCELPFRREDGATFHARLESIRLPGPGKSPGVRVTISDVTEHNRMREQFLQAQKMEAIGQLAGGVAHNFRNQLTVIKGYAEMLLRRQQVSSEGADGVRQILNAVDRSTVVSSQLLAFSRQQILSRTLVKLDTLTRELASSTAHTLREDVQLSLATRPDLWATYVDPGQFHQALLNLVLNARDAMPRGGRITIETENFRPDEDFRRRHPQAGPDRYVLVTVGDDGEGMDEATLSHLFEPFFTSKPVDKGTGLGLAMVHGFIAQSRGYVEVDSQPGRGTTFRLYFPAAWEGIVSTPAPPAEPEPMPSGGGTVLVVEDEDALRSLLCCQLRELGFVVLEAQGVSKAWSLLETLPGRLDLLVTDVIMPDGNGVDLADRMAASRPGTAVLFISGYGGDDLALRGVSMVAARFLSKPFSGEQFADSVRTALAGTHTQDKQ